MVIYHNEHFRLLFLLKVIRVINAMKVLDVQTIFEGIQSIQRKNSIKMIKKDPIFGEDTSQDHNNVEKLLKIKYCLRTLKLILIILNFSYFLGMFWLIISSQVHTLTDEYYREIAEGATNHLY